MEPRFSINACSTRSLRQHPNFCARAHSMADSKQHAVHAYLGNWLNFGVRPNCIAFISTSRSPLNRFTPHAGQRLLGKSPVAESLKCLQRWCESWRHGASALLAIRVCSHSHPKSESHLLLPLLTFPMRSTCSVSLRRSCSHHSWQATMHAK